MLKRIFKTRNAETILEVIISLFVISIGATVTTTLIVNAIASNAYGKNNLIALNLAVEGIEAMRDIRDSNWLKYSYDKANCWNMLPNPKSAVDKDNCNDVLNLIAPGNYTADLNLQTMKWEMTNVAGSGLNLPANGPAQPSDENFRLWFVDLSGATAKQIYVSKYVGLTGGITPHTASQFYRMITVSYSGGAAFPAAQTNMTVTSLVQWYEGPIVRQIQLDTILTNYNRVKTS